MASVSTKGLDRFGASIRQPVAWFAMGVAVVLFGWTNEAHAFCQATTSGRALAALQCPREGQPLHWPSYCAGLYLDARNVSPALGESVVRSTLDAAITSWNLAPCTSALSGARSFALGLSSTTCASLGESVAFVRGAPSASVVSFRTRWSDSPLFAPGVIAATVLTFDVRDGTLLDADVALNTRSEANPEGFVFSVQTPLSPDTRSLAAVLTHELGHVMGLAHSDTNDALMVASYDLSAPRVTVREDDAAGRCAIYPALQNPLCNRAPERGDACVPGCQCRSDVPSQAPSPTARWAAAMAFVTLSLRRKSASKRSALGH